MMPEVIGSLAVGAIIAFVANLVLPGLSLTVLAGCFALGAAVGYAVQKATHAVYAAFVIDQLSE